MSSSSVLVAGIVVITFSAPNYAVPRSENLRVKSGVTIYKPEKCYQSYTLHSSRQTEVAKEIAEIFDHSITSAMSNC